jgi:predicted component of type VI protein secretion system
MPEQVFTIFLGPDAGRQFTVGERPVTLGRDEAREVALNDDRASRLHARIIPLADGLSIVDENSSNGTFVNGALVRERRIEPGDIIVIGANSIVFGPRKPPPERLVAARPGAMRAVPSQVPGATTHLLPESTKAPEVAESRLGAIVEAVAESVRKDAHVRGIHLSVEIEAYPDVASVDPQQLFRALAGLMEHYLEAVPPASHPDSASRVECAMAVRLTASAKHEGFEIEIFGVGLPVAREKIAPDANHQSLRDARRVIAAHGGLMEAVPADAPATLVRIFIPRSSTGTMQTMMR